MSHIATGYWYNSAAAGKVRADENYAGGFASSLFDYTNVDADGKVLNKLRGVDGSVGNKPTCYSDHVPDPGFPLITTDILRNYGASFGGIAKDPLMGYVQTVSVILMLLVPLQF